MLPSNSNSAASVASQPAECNAFNAVLLVASYLAFTANSILCYSYNHFYSIYCRTRFPETKLVIQETLFFQERLQSLTNYPLQMFSGLINNTKCPSPRNASSLLQIILSKCFPALSIIQSGRYSDAPCALLPLGMRASRRLFYILGNIFF